jgi:hypothetical protein
MTRPSASALISIGAVLAAPDDMTVKYVDRPPDGWFVLDVMRAKSRSWDWDALMIDVDPDNLANYSCSFPVLFYMHPKDHKPENPPAHQVFVRVPGKHRNRDAASAAFKDYIRTAQH